MRFQWREMLKTKQKPTIPHPNQAAPIFPPRLTAEDHSFSILKYKRG